MKQKTIFLGAGLMILSFLKVYPQQENLPVLKGPYLGQKPPGKTPELFAPDIRMDNMEIPKNSVLRSTTSIRGNILHT